MTNPERVKEFLRQRVPYWFDCGKFTDLEIDAIVACNIEHASAEVERRRVAEAERDSLAARVEQLELEKALGDLWEDCASAGSDIPSQVEMCAPSPEFWMAAEKALAAPSPAVVALNAAAQELDIVDIISKVEALLHRGRALSDLDYDRGFSYAITSVLSLLHALAEVQK